MVDRSHDDSACVIIPAFNAENSLDRAIGSALSQTHAPAEIVVINDGSTDATGDVARSYGTRITYIEQENFGQGAARNAGLRAVRSEFIAFLDADDYWLPGFTSTCVAFLRAHPEAVAVNTAHIIRRGGQERIGPVGLLRGCCEESGSVLESFYDTWAAHDHVRTGTVVIRHEAIRKAGPQLGIRISQDLEYWGYLATFGPWGFIPQPLWVGDSHAQGVRSGWLKKYRKRRKACPSVEEWEHRIVPRLRERDVSAFKVVRGRVAASYMYAKIASGDFKGARCLLDKYGHEMPVNPLTTWSRRARSLGVFSWHAFCQLVQFREYLKALR